MQALGNTCLLYTSLVALCSIGPILAVLILGLLYHTEGSAALEVVSEVENSIELGKLFAVALPKYFKEIAVSLFPIVVFFGIFQIVSLKLNKTVPVSYTHLWGITSSI